MYIKKLNNKAYQNLLANLTYQQITNFVYINSRKNSGSNDVHFC